MSKEKGWRDLNQSDKEDLEDWYNTSPLSPEDKKNLARLFWAGGFQAWNCPHCGKRVFRGTPKDWGKFQGTRNQDFLSYPGNIDVYTEHYLSRMCNDCRSEYNENWEYLWD